MADLSLPSLLTRLLSYAAPIFNTSSLGRRTAYGEPHLRPEIDRMMALMGWRADADVAELVDALDLGSSAERRGGSSPFIRTTLRSSSFGWRAIPKLVRRRSVLLSLGVGRPLRKNSGRAADAPVLAASKEFRRRVSAQATPTGSAEPVGFLFGSDA